MIAVMPDFARIDRELAAIGTVPDAVQPLLDQYGQRDRSLENVDLVLEALREGREPTSGPPDSIERPSFLPLGWDADRKSEPGIEALAPGSLASAPLPTFSDREEITATSGAPESMNDDAAHAAAASPAAEASAEPAAVFPPPVSDEEASLEGHIDTQQSSPPPPAEPELTEPEPSAPAVAMQGAAIEAAPHVLADPDPELFEQRVSRSSRPPRPDLQALLDAELDPREFPSTTPPPKLTRSSLPPAITSPLPPRPSGPAASDELELLVDDDDILEIEDEA